MATKMQLLVTIRPFLHLDLHLGWPGGPHFWLVKEKASVGQGAAAAFRGTFIGNPLTLATRSEAHES